MYFFSFQKIGLLLSMTWSLLPYIVLCDACFCYFYLLFPTLPFIIVEVSKNSPWFCYSSDTHCDACTLSHSNNWGLYSFSHVACTNACSGSYSFRFGAVLVHIQMIILTKASTLGHDVCISFVLQCPESNLESHTCRANTLQLSYIPGPLSIFLLVSGATHYFGTRDQRQLGSASRVTRIVLSTCGRSRD